jgi:Disulphide bond corrector protein DsbC
MKKRSFNLLFVTLVLCIAGVSALKAQTVTGSIANGTVSRGKAAQAIVILSIPGGLHVNSSRPASEYAIPTSVRPSATGARISAVRYPRGRDHKFSFSEVPINVYEGTTKFTFSVTVPEAFKGKRISVRVAVKYQACTEEVCYRPTTKDVTLTANVR